MAKLLIKDGKIQLRDGKVLTSAACCYRQAVKCGTIEGIDFWAMAEDTEPEASEGKSWLQDDCYVQWGSSTLCLPEDATLDDVESITYVDACDGFMQAYRCPENTPLDRWILASDAESGYFEEGDGCAQWGTAVPCLPDGATAGSAPAEYFDSCDDCEDAMTPPEPFICCVADSTSLTIVTAGITMGPTIGVCYPFGGSNSLKLTGAINPNRAWTTPGSAAGTYIVAGDASVFGDYWNGLGNICFGTANETVQNLHAEIIIGRNIDLDCVIQARIRIFVDHVTGLGTVTGRLIIADFFFECIDGELVPSTVTIGNRVGTPPVPPGKTFGIADGGTALAET